jgi:hypothetical protein
MDKKSGDTGNAFEDLAAEHQRIGVAILEGLKELDSAALLQATGLSYVFATFDNWDGGTDVYDVHLAVDARQLSLYTDKVKQDISGALEQIIKPIGRVWLGNVLLIPTEPQTSLSNQAINPMLSAPQPSRHNMRFRSEAEAIMFDSLAEKQKQLPKADTILIIPLPSVWTGRNRWEPDFIVTYKGRSGVIEIDDPTHRN